MAKHQWTKVAFHHWWPFAPVDMMQRAWLSKPTKCTHSPARRPAFLPLAILNNSIVHAISHFHTLLSLVQGRFWQPLNCDVSDALLAELNGTRPFSSWATATGSHRSSAFAYLIWMVKGDARSTSTKSQTMLCWGWMNKTLVQDATMWWFSHSHSQSCSYSEISHLCVDSCTSRKGHLISI